MATQESPPVGGELVESDGGALLVGGRPPGQIVAQAEAMANALKPLVDRRSSLTGRPMKTRIGGKDHIQIEAWQILAKMAGVAVSSHAEPLDEPPVDYVVETKHYEGKGADRQVVRTTTARITGAAGARGYATARLGSTGMVIAEATARCDRSEASWRNDSPNSIESMAQTRAQSKVLRGILGDVVHLAGYAPTPAEEMDPDRPPEEHRPPPVEQALIQAASTALVRIYGGDVELAKRAFQAIKDELDGLFTRDAGVALKVAGSLVGNGGEPTARKSTPQQRVLNAAEKRKLFAVEDKAGIKDNEKLRKAIYVWVAGEEHEDRIPADKLDELLAAVKDHEATVDAILQHADEGNGLAQELATRYLDQGPQFQPGDGQQTLGGE